MGGTCHATPQTDFLAWHPVGLCVDTLKGSKMSDTRVAILITGRRTASKCLLESASEIFTSAPYYRCKKRSFNFMH